MPADSSKSKGMIDFIGAGCELRSPGCGMGARRAKSIAFGALGHGAELMGHDAQSRAI